LQIPSVFVGNLPPWVGVEGPERALLGAADDVLVAPLVERAARRLWRVFAATALDAAALSRPSSEFLRLTAVKGVKAPAAGVKYPLGSISLKNSSKRLFAL